MARKPHSPSSSPATPDQPDASSSLDGTAAAQNVWLAGLGALANAHAEGSKAFEALVKQGLDMQNKAQQLARERMEAMASPSVAAAPWNRLGGIFEDRVAHALASMGMPTAQELSALTARVEALERALQAQQPSPARAAAKRPAARK